jgi:hypothetical protein
MRVPEDDPGVMMAETGRGGRNRRRRRKHKEVQRGSQSQ